MAKDDHIELRGTVTLTHAGGFFTVVLEDGRDIKARLSGRIRQKQIRVVVGDKVTISVSPYDPSHGLITYRDR